MALFQLSNIYFKLPTIPSNTFNTGDYCYIFYDSDAKGIKVYKNGSLITSGDNIFYPFPEWRGNERLYQVLTCSGSDRLVFKRISTFPYYTIGFLYGHPSCGIPIVCDLAFNSIADVTNASGKFNNNGSLTVSATSSNTGIQYKLNEDFVYGFGQTSGTFNNLTPGLYIVYARDSKNCRAVQSVRVGISESYGVKYRFQFTSRDGKTHKTEILEKGYTGSVIDVDGADNSVIYRLRGEGKQEKFTTILASEIEFNIISKTEGEFSELSTNDPEKFRIRHTINSTIKWIGKVLINQYEENYTNPPYPISIIATDALPNLVDIPFLDDNNLPFNGVVKQIDVIAFILRKLNLGINIRSATNIYAILMNNTASDDPLDQAYIDLSRYYLSQNDPTCAQVLQWILEPYTAGIVQWENKWFICRLEERTDFFNYREYDQNGNYVSNGTYTPIINLKNSSYSNRMVWANQNQTVRVMPGYGSIRLIYDLGNKINIIENGDFRLRSIYNYDFMTPTTGVAADLTGFEIINNVAGSGVMIDYEKFEDDKIAVIFDSWLSQGKNYIISKTYNLKTGNRDKLKINFRYKIGRSYWKSQPTFAFTAWYIKVKLLVKYGNYYLREDGNWTTVSSYIINIVKKDKFNEYIDLEILAASPDFSYIDGADFSVRIFLPDVNETEHQSSTTSAAITLLKEFKTINNLGYSTIPIDYKTEVYDIDGTYYSTDPAILFYELKEDTNSQSLPDIVRPKDYNSTTNPYQWILQYIQQYNEDIVTSLYVDKISVEILSDNKSIANNQSLEKSMENNNDTSLGKTILHGSLTNTGNTLITSFKQSNFWNDGIELTLSNNNGFTITNAQWFNIYSYTANAADIIYSGYLRDSLGVGFVQWKRTAYAEIKTLQEIFIDSYGSQYNKSWRLLNGDMYSDDTFFGPMNTLKETIDNDTLYIPISLEIDFYRNLYKAEFMELFDIDDNSPAGFSKGFSTGFNA